MLKRDFLEKPYDYMNDILLFLYNNQGKSTKSKLIEEFQISLPTLNEYLSFLQSFLEENGISDQVRITTSGDHLSLTKELDFPLKKVVLLFLDKSIKFQMVNQLFQKNEVSCDYFQLSYAISSATYYRKVTELNELLKEFHLQIKRGKIVGEEKQIRYFFFNFFWYLFEDKTELEKETSNQYLGFIETLKESLNVTFDPTEIFQIKLWMKISLRRMTVELNPVISPNYDHPDRPLFEEINLAFHTYMKKIDRPYTIYEAYMFYDFFCSMNNFSANSSFAFRLAEAQRTESSYLNYMNKVILKYLKQQGYLTTYASDDRLSYIENLLFQLHSRLYYFDGFILPFDYWTITSIINAHRHPFTGNEVDETMRIASEKFDSSEEKNRFINRFTQIHYTIILNHIAELNEEKITIGVYHSLNPSIGELVMQHLTNVLGHKFPIKAELYQEDSYYDILLSNIYNEAIAENQKTTYVFSDVGNNYDMNEVKKIILNLLDK
ncbi:helix-turn-helix domain-containing protein [Enterococcus sp. BWB1-3]|uniref:helix-turn-helix domain-containing protein n=1 Tax=unclassified Enterococcus TaxID=2608891 RepID=UPI001924832E|nr:MULTISPECIES: helix-turn-helix domain-containing protein [unclassified Enterococcus]MBL1227703.1 helix-turn-helix domain-containing protein [Enterococcus sp. BWB1-3]MCB5952110.1 helix-turn-helix domain-containing protein [Enterococcus sp. BWT-B8]